MEAEPRERKKLGEEGVGAMEARVEEEIGGGGDSVPFSPCFRQIFLPFPLSTNRLTPCGPTGGEKQRQRPILPRDVASVDSLGEPHGGAAIIPLDALIIYLTVENSRWHQYIMF
jgi:hypothetical protein